MTFQLAMPLLQSADFNRTRLSDRDVGRVRTSDRRNRSRTAQCGRRHPTLLTTRSSTSRTCPSSPSTSSCPVSAGGCGVEQLAVNGALDAPSRYAPVSVAAGVAGSTGARLEREAELRDHVRLRRRGQLRLERHLPAAHRARDLAGRGRNGFRGRRGRRRRDQESARDHQRDEKTAECVNASPLTPCSETETCVMRVTGIGRVENPAATKCAVLQGDTGVASPIVRDRVQDVGRARDTERRLEARVLEGGARK